MTDSWQTSFVCQNLLTRTKGATRPNRYSKRRQISTRFESASTDGNIFSPKVQTSGRVPGSSEGGCANRAREINQTPSSVHKPSFPIIKVGSRASMSSRPETGVSKADGGISVLLNFTDFPSPLYRFIALEGRSLVSPSNDGYCRVTYLWRISTWLLSVARNPRFTRARVSPPVEIL